MRGRGEGRDALRSGFPGKVLSEPGAPGRRDLLVLVFSCSALSCIVHGIEKSGTQLSDFHFLFILDSTRMKHPECANPQTQ